MLRGLYFHAPLLEVGAPLGIVHIIHVGLNERFAFQVDAFKNVAVIFRRRDKLHGDVFPGMQANTFKDNLLCYGFLFRHLLTL